ncbi:hypothetical protein GIB67_000648 [Kingdonia uniflora]|uniref:Uncharacterized protein n=1 Tax=Kingdonia uniflora TaxID=39325 RepID=A0A7J7NDC8_9MAGN|nr:hypothetical protein GIB67_000648 [Kingdonia uniflora]
MASSEKRCLYETLGLPKDCSPEEIRSSYRKLALQLHPDKLIKTGIPEDQATSAFQELVNAYEVLSDPKERSWYDSHRSQILFSDAKTSGSVPELFTFFSSSVFSGFGDTGKGFYKVYGDVFNKIYAQEVNFATKLGLGLRVDSAPLMGNLKSGYDQVSAFYSYWFGFCSVMDFCWVDEYDAMAGLNRKSRRLMEEENKKLRKKAKREYNDTVRGLAEFVKKRDKRVIEMQMKKNLEQEKKREVEIARKKEADRVKLERARLYVEPDWAKNNDDDMDEVEEIPEDESVGINKKNDSKELYCVVCSKKFKSDKQWKNHEQSKKHREKVAELKYSYDIEEEEGEEDELKEEEVLGGEVDETHADLEEDVDELYEHFEDAIDIQEEQESEVQSDSADRKEVEETDDTTDEMRILKQMISGHKSKKSAASTRQPNSFSGKSPDNISDSEEMDDMEYNRRKTTRRNRKSKREAAGKSNGEAAREEKGETIEDVLLHSSNGNIAWAEKDNDHDIEDFSSHTVEEVLPNIRGDKRFDKSSKGAYQPVDRKATINKDSNAKSKSTSKGKKQKAASKNTGHLCDTCGEDFVSRNQLHKHLGSTGHASLKSS